MKGDDLRPLPVLALQAINYLQGLPDGQDDHAVTAAFVMPTTAKTGKQQTRQRKRSG